MSSQSLPLSSHTDQKDRPLRWRNHFWKGTSYLGEAAALWRFLPDPFFPLSIREYPSFPGYRLTTKHDNVSCITSFSNKFTFLLNFCFKKRQSSWKQFSITLIKNAIIYKIRAELIFQCSFQHSDPDYIGKIHNTAATKYGQRCKLSFYLLLSFYAN